MKRGGFDFASVAPLYNDLIQRGFSPIHAASIAGNFAYEAGPKGRIDYGAQELKPTAGRGGYGAAQWTGARRVGLEQFANKNHLPISDRETQMKYFDQERNGSERAAFNRLQKTGDVNSATKSFMQNYERPRASTANLAQRQQYAQEILARGQRGDYNSPGETQVAKNSAPLPPSRPGDLGRSEIAQNAPPPGSVLNRINPKDPSGPLLPENGQQQLAQLNPNDLGKGVPASNMQTPGIGKQLEPMPQMASNDAPLPPSRPGELNQTLMADAPMPPSRPAELNQTMMAQNAPMPPSRPESLAPVPVNIAQQPSSGMSSMLMEPQGGRGGVEGMAASASPQHMAQATPSEMFNPQMMAQQTEGFGGGGLGDLFSEAFMPAEMPQTQFADAGTDFGGGFGGFDLGSLFA